MALFDDEVLSVVLKFSNPNRREMEDADKIATKLSMALDGVVRKSVSAGQAVGDVFEGIKRLEPTLKSLEKRAGTIGASAGALKTAQQILARYTPARLEKLAEVQASRIAESSGTASLRRQLEKHGDLIKRLVATQEGRYERATKGSSVGRGLFIDTESTGLNALKHQITELSATLFTFNKATGEILNQQEKAYHGFQQLAFQSRHQYMPQGVTPSQLQSQAISTTMLRRLMQQADFVVAHNAPHDKKFVERLVPQAAGMMWLDSMKGIPWRTLGHSSRAQQDLLRAHGISPGQAHRASDDVRAGVKLLSSRSPLGGPTYMGMLMGNQGPLNQAQQLLAQIKHMADEIRSDLSSRLGDAGSRHMSPSANYKSVVENFASRAPGGIAEFYSKQIIATIEGGIDARSRRPGRSTDYGIKFGSGVAPEVTPGALGHAAIALDRRLGVIDQFVRNMAIASGPTRSAGFIEDYAAQGRFQEGVQQGRGRGRQIKSDIRSGDEVALTTMQGLNTQYRNRRLGNRGTDPDIAWLRDINEDKIENAKRMLSQPWARPEHAYGDEEISRFIAAHSGSAGVGSIRGAAQMASHVGPNDHRFLSLASIMFDGQQAGRQLASSKVAQAQKEAIDRLAGNVGSRPKSGFRNVIGEALRGLSSSGLGNERGSVPFDFLTGGLFSFFQKRKQHDNKASFKDYDELARGPLQDSTTLRGSMRRDALEQKLRKLGDVVESTAKEFQKFRDVTAQARTSEAARSYSSRDYAITAGLNATNNSLDSQLARLEGRRLQSRASAGRQLGNIQDTFESRSSSLGFSELDAEAQFEVAKSRQDRATARLRSQYNKNNKRKYSDDQVNDMVSGITKPAEFRMLKAEYNSKLSQLTDPEEIDKLRRQTAASFSVAKYGNRSNPEAEKLRSDYADRVYGLFGGKSLAQKATARAGQVGDDQASREKEIDQAVGQIRNRREAAENSAEQKRSDNTAKFTSAKTKLEDEVEKRRLAGIKKITDAEKKAHEARVKYLKTEDAAGGGSGAHGGGSGGSRGGGGNFSSREGFQFGLGLSTLASYGMAIWSGIKDSAIYAANVDALKFSTQEIAKVNSLDVGAVVESVNSIKKLNMTTQSANQVVQRMIFAQLDVGKAGQIAQVAQNVSVISGQTPSEAVDRIINGVSTGLTISLHRMGLPVSMLQVNRQLTADRRAEGKTGPASEVEKRQALLNAVILEGAKANGLYEKSLMTAGGQLKQFEQNMQELQYSVGKEFLPEFGRFVSLMSSGTKFIDANAEGVSKLVSVLASLTAAAGTAGSLAFFSFLAKSATKIPGWVGVVSAGVGVASYLMLNKNKTTAMADTANEQRSSLKSQMAALKSERDKLNANRDNSPEWRNAMDSNTAAIKATAESDLAIYQKLTDDIAEEYNKRVKNLDDYIATSEGKNGKLKMFLQMVGGGPPGSPAFDFLPMEASDPRDKKGVKEYQQHVAAIRANILKEATPTGTTSHDVLKESVRQRLEQLRVSRLPSTILNKEKADLQAMRSEMVDAEGQLNKLDQQYGEEGTVGLRARKAMGTPRQKVMLDYEQEAEKVNKLIKDLKALKSSAASGDAGAQTKLAGLGADKVDSIIDRGGLIVGEAGKDRDIQLSKIDRQNKAQIGQVREQMQLEQIQSATVLGNYESERAAILKTFDVKQQTAKKTLSLMEDVDGYNRQVAQNEVDSDTALLHLSTERKRAEQGRQEKILMHGADVTAQSIMEDPNNDAEQAIRDAFSTKFNAARSIEDDNKRFEEQLNLVFDLGDALRNLAKEKKSLAAEGRISEFQDNQQLAMEIDRTISAKAGKRQSTTHRALAEIERTRLGEVAIADQAYGENISVTDPAGRPALDQQHVRQVRQANIKAAEDSIKVVDQERDTAKERLAKSLERKGSDSEEVLQGLATSQNEEIAAAENIHNIRLKYIEEEYKARGESLEAEQQKEEEIHQVEMDKLKQMLDLRKQQVEGIRSFSEGLFNTLATDHAHGLRDFMMGQVKGIGAKVFGNLMVDTFKGVHTNLPGLESTDAQGNKHPTFLGRLFSGTGLGRKVPADKDINEQIKKVNELNTKATDKNTDAIDKLTDTLDQILQGMGIAPNTAPSSVGGAGGGFNGTVPGGRTFNLGPRFGGSTAAPFSFGALPSGFPSPLVPLPLGYGGGAAPPGAIDTTMHFDDGTSSPTTTSYVGLDQAGNQVVGGPGSGVGASTTQVPSGSQPAASGGGSSTPVPTKGSPLSGIPGLGGAVSGAISGLSKLSPSAGKYAAAGIQVATGAYQAITELGKAGARNKAFGAAGLLTSAAGIAMMVPGGQVVAPFLELGALGADLFGSFFQDPKQKRTNQIANYLAANAYMAPAQLDLTSTLQGNLAAESKGGKVTDTGITANSIKVTAPSIEVLNPTSFLSSILPSGKPTINGFLGQGQGTISADDFSGQQLTYAQIPGQVSYAGLAGQANNPVNIHVSAMDSQSFMDRSADITAAVQKELSLGNGVSLAMQNSIFGTG